MKLCLENINKDVDYDDLCFFESHLAHELKRLGKEGFVKKYKSGVESFRIDSIKFCYLIALLEYLDNTFTYDSSIKLDKFILDARDYDFAVEDNDFTLANDRLRKVLPQFYKRGFIYSDIDLAV